jgi:hypothetical protein
MLLPWSSIITLLAITYGVFVLIALRGLCGLVSDQLTALRTARAARPLTRVSHAPIPRDTVRAGFASTVHAQA